MVVLSARWASQATTSSKSRVCRASGRAHGTSSVTARRHRSQLSLRISAWDLQPRRPQVQVALPVDGSVVGCPGNLPAGRASEPARSPPQADGHHSRSDLHGGHGGPEDGQDPVECCADVHASPLLGRLGWLSKRRTYRGSDMCASSVAAPG
jgi:hypothetical protein